MGFYSYNKERDGQRRHTVQTPQDVDDYAGDRGSDMEQRIGCKNNRQARGRRCSQLNYESEARLQVERDSQSDVLRG